MGEGRERENWGGRKDETLPPPMFTRIANFNASYVGVLCEVLFEKQGLDILGSYFKPLVNV